MNVTWRAPTPVLHPHAREPGNLRVVLLVLNGAPGVGKSTLARRYADEHPLTLVIDIDALRTQLGQWERVDESKLVARDLAVALVRAHLLTERDVIVPQYLGRADFLDRLRDLAVETHAPFIEVVLTDDPDRITTRFRTRRAGYAAGRVHHPQADLRGEDVAMELIRANDRLLRDAAGRGVPVVSVERGTDAAYRLLCETLAAIA